MGNVKTRC